MRADPERVLLGVITPSSNTRLEPLTCRMLHGLAEVSAHFSRFRVVDVGLDAVSQFDPAPIVAAASRLGDARVDANVWSGTSGAGQGLDADRRLCAAVTEATGAPATTSTLALLDALEVAGAHRVGLITPYPDDMHDTVASTLSRAGKRATVSCSRNHPFSPSNWELSLLPPEELDRLVGEVAAESPDVITTFCTNLAAADRVRGWEKRFGVPVFDSTALAVWAALRLAGVDPARVDGWGQLFTL
jgi:maleate isomerase